MFFAVGFAEFVGVPIVSLPGLIGGGAMVASGTLGFGGGGGVRGGRRLARRPRMVRDRPSTRLLVDRFGLVSTSHAQTGTRKQELPRHH